MKPAILAAAAAIFLAMTPVPAAAEGGWNGTWIGDWQSPNGTQIVFAGDTFISIFWNGEYITDAAADTTGGGAVKITWTGGSAELARDGDDTASIVIHEKDKPDVSFELRHEAN